MPVLTPGAGVPALLSRAMYGTSLLTRTPCLLAAFVAICQRFMYRRTLFIVAYTPRHFLLALHARLSSRYTPRHYGVQRSASACGVAAQHSASAGCRRRRPADLSCGYASEQARTRDAWRCNSVGRWRCRQPLYVAAQGKALPVLMPSIWGVHGREDGLQAISAAEDISGTNGRDCCHSHLQKHLPVSLSLNDNVQRRGGWLGAISLHWRAALLLNTLRTGCVAASSLGLSHACTLCMAWDSWEGACLLGVWEANSLTLMAWRSLKLSRDFFHIQQPLGASHQRQPACRAGMGRSCRTLPVRAAISWPDHSTSPTPSASGGGSLFMGIGVHSINISNILSVASMSSSRTFVNRRRP